LLGASYFFYGFWDYRFLALILVSTAVDFFAAQRVELLRSRENKRAARLWLWASIGVNLGILGFFKYFNFFIDSFSSMFSAAGIDVVPYTLELVLPVGISFYTFQTMSYTIDVYRGRQRAKRDAPEFALYVAFFPQLMAGPIERARRLIPQIEKPRIIAYEDLREGGWSALPGLKSLRIVAPLAYHAGELVSRLCVRRFAQIAPG
jgi:D-alanyl-lipoteichoic acid acyltransferase DltB (MBOAT superfamily)